MALGQADFVLAQRAAVSFVGVLFIRRTIGDVAIDDDQRGPVAGVLEGAKGPLQHFQIVGVADPQHVPVVTDKAGRHVLAERPIGVAFDGDFVVVIQPAEIRQFKMPG